jgi:hypothetical protein
MKRHDKMVSQLMALVPSIVGIEWTPYSTRATLRLRGETGRQAALLLDGVHLFMTRQTMLGRPSSSAIDLDRWEDWVIDHLDILGDSPFLTHFLSGDLGSPCGVEPYDTQGRPLDAGTRPVHVTISAGEGAMDFICETIELKE